MADIYVKDGLVIPGREIDAAFSRSSGPGGQNVNKVSTRVTLSLDIAASEALDDRQKARIRERLHTRITRGGVLKVSSQRYRTQKENRRAAEEKMAELIAGALARRRPRIKPRPPRSINERRLEIKKRRAALKKLRGKVQED